MRRSPWAAWAAFVVVAIGATVLEVSYGARDNDRGDFFQRVAIMTAFAVFVTVGTVILSRRPGHAIGRIYLWGGMAAAVEYLATALRDVDRVMHGTMPGRALVWLVDDLFSDLPLVVVIAMPLLLFPNGALPSRRWRWPFRIALLCLAFIAARSLVPGHFDHSADVAPRNPLGIPGAKRLLEQLAINATTVLGIIVLAAIVSLFLRFRRSTGSEREQLKWLGWAGIWALFLLAFSGPITFSGVLPDVIQPLANPLVPFTSALAFAVIPLFTAVGILRYRLYDIDRIISRTVSYVLITGSLLGVYLGLVVIFELATRPFTKGSDLAVAASTLVVAAAFRPVRRRVQSTIDHRFNRARYDAVWAIDAFAARLRDEVDIDELTSDLQTLVHQMMEPSHVSIWLRG